MTGRFNNVLLDGRAMLIAIGAFAGLFLACAATGVRFNATESLPLGMYVSTAGETNLVEFCPPEPFASIAVRRGYRRRGNCPDRGMPLLKPVVAVAGDRVSLSRLGIAVNGHLLENTAALDSDSNGRALPQWPFGIHHVARGTVWVASSYSPRSFDSRYFGPIPVAAIRQYVRPMLTSSKLKGSKRGVYANTK
jgi:conjugative transfer signal peptidase TraF